MGVAMWSGSYHAKWSFQSRLWWKWLAGWTAASSGSGGLGFVIDNLYASSRCACVARAITTRSLIRLSALHHAYGCQWGRQTLIYTLDNSRQTLVAWVALFVYLYYALLLFVQPCCVVIIHLAFRHHIWRSDIMKRLYYLQFIRKIQLIWKMMSTIECDINIMLFSHQI